jgi:hypothetical protein
MTRNASELIELSRQRQAHVTGARFGLDPTVVPPPVARVACSRSACERIPTGEPGGIGIERAGAAAPELFGTWDPKEFLTWQPAAQTTITTRYEGGRNTPRGGTGPEMR